MSITKVAEPQARSPYDVAYLEDGELDAREARRRLEHFATKLGAPESGALARRLFDGLPNNFDVPQRYSKTLKLLSMSREYLFLDFNQSDEQASRFTSYALLKRKPSEAFQEDFYAFRSGELTSEALATRIVASRGFRSFLREFVQGWFGAEVELDIEKYDKHTRKLDLDQEPVSHLLYIFANDRPLREVFRSDYKVVNSTLAPYYGIRGARSGEPQVHRGTAGGVLQQMAFLKSQSDGIDGLPFRRAEWVLENVFNERLGNPPNSIDNDEFVATKEVTTFRQRTEAHSRNAACYECHKAIDPVAFAFQHLDVLGERVAEPELLHVTEFANRLRRTEEAQVRAFATQFVQYITGRETTIYDQGVIEDFMSREKQSGFRSRALVAHVLNRYFGKTEG